MLIISVRYITCAANLPGLLLLLFYNVITVSHTGFSARVRYDNLIAGRHGLDARRRRPSSALLQFGLFPSPPLISLAVSSSTRHSGC